MLQIAVVGIVNIFQQEKRNKVLGVFCLLLIFSLMKRAFWETIEGSGLYCILGGPHEILYAPLLYTYLSVSKNKLDKKYGYHLIIAFLIYLILHLVAILFFRGSHHSIAPFFLLSIITFSIVYFFKGLQLYKHQLKERLKPYPRRRFQFFYISANVYILLKAFVISFAFLNAIIEHPILENLYTNFSLPVFYYIVVPLFILLCFSYIFYGLTEVTGLKKSILTVDIHKKERKPASNYQKIWELLDDHKVYADPDISLNTFINTYDINSTLFRQFLEDHAYENFQHLLNGYRIKDFKKRICHTSIEKYDLFSIAKESGFKSKATFYRVFKKQEDMTPGEYIDSISSS
ncbi:helix-turn-helix domain-containing protein [Aquimarina sp. 2201CG1-2-11]|uniref:helix-turn-helix domain-containing protein n=1 Tax=Aquimarina discodermiae TaxID=3231043 RepID=UPI003461D3BA